MICKVKTYNGNKPYIFFSYCHTDAEEVYPIIETMAYAGYRIWYDEGIHPGADWPEVIAQKLADSFMCIVAVSPASTKSHNCRNEMTFAVENNKHLISIQLENFFLPLGIKLQLSSTQIIKKYKYSSTEFYSKLYTNENLKNCLGNSQRAPVNDEVAKAEKIKQEQEAEKQRIATEETERLRREQEAERQRIIAEEAERLISEQETDETLFYDEKDSEETILIDEDDDVTIIGEDSENTIMEEENSSLVVIRLNTSELFFGNYPMTSIGRSRNECDIYFESVSTVSSHHADIIIYDSHCFLVDHHSANSTYINGRKMEKDERCEINNYAEIGLSHAENLFIALDKYAEWILDNMCLVSLMSVETHEKMYFFNSETIIGRSYPWASGAMTDGRIGRQHAVIKIYDGKCFIMDKSRNGTEINNRGKIEQMKWIELHNEDKIKMGKEKFILNIYSLKKGVIL